MSQVQFMNWVDFDELRQKTNLVLVPLGAVEVYGPHLPMGADGIATEALAIRVAKEEPAIVAPLIPVAYSKSLMTFPGTLTVRPETLVAYTRDMVECFIHWGARRILFINGHAANVPYLNHLGLDLEEEHGVKVAQIDWWRFIQPLVTDLVEADSMPHGHASEFGTSVMLHLAGEHVRMERAMRAPRTEADAFPDFLRPGTYTARTEYGIVGDATVGSEAKGAETMNRAVARALEFLRSDAFRV